MYLLCTCICENIPLPNPFAEIQNREAKNKSTSGIRRRKLLVKSTRILLLSDLIMAQAVELENLDIWGSQLRNTLSRSVSRTMRMSNPNSIRSWSTRAADLNNVFTRSIRSRRDSTDDDDDEEALKWAALEKLPTYDRLRTSILKSMEGGKVITQEINVTDLGTWERQMLIDRLLKVAEEDNEKFLHKLRNRIDKYEENH